jgi:hypothetical protein
MLHSFQLFYTLHAESNLSFGVTFIDRVVYAADDITH